MISFILTGMRSGEREVSIVVKHGVEAKSYEDVSFSGIIKFISLDESQKVSTSGSYSSHRQQRE